MRDNLTTTKGVKKTKVAIVGFTASWKRAPFNEPDWEVWGMNAAYDLPLPRWDRWFELHQRQVNLNDEGPRHIWKIAELTCPVYMIKQFDDIPTSVAYPLDKVLAQFRPYMTSTFSYMAALAIMEGFEEIGVYGVDTADEEWGSQRPSLEYLLGYAEGKGIKVTIPKESSLLRAPFLYGYQEREENEFLGKLANHEFGYKRKLDRADEMRETYAIQSARYSGALGAIRNLRKEWQTPFDFGDIPVPDESTYAAKGQGDE